MDFVGVPLPIIGAGTGWAAFLSLVLYITRKIIAGKLVAESIHLAAIAAGDKVSAQLDRLQETHAQTTAQNGELLETARFTKAVTEALDKARSERA